MLVTETEYVSSCVTYANCKIIHPTRNSAKSDVVILSTDCKQIVIIFY